MLFVVARRCLLFYPLWLLLLMLLLFVNDLLPENESILEANDALLARKREILHLCFTDALPMNEEWKMSPYLGVLLRVLSALNYLIG